MEDLHIKILESVILIVAYYAIKLISSRIIDKTLSEKLIQETRGIIIKKFISAALIVICTIFAVLIWRINQEDLAVFIGSTLTVVGIAFFAQWSILSNITSSIIIFFNHPVRFGDDIVILETKDYVIEGQVANLGLFFITLKTPDDEEITIPNNMFIQKSIKNSNKPSAAATAVSAQT